MLEVGYCQDILLMYHAALCPNTLKMKICGKVFWDLQELTIWYIIGQEIINALTYTQRMHRHLIPGLIKPVQNLYFH